MLGKSDGWVWSIAGRSPVGTCNSSGEDGTGGAGARQGRAEPGWEGALVAWGVVNRRRIQRRTRQNET